MTDFASDYLNGNILKALFRGTTFPAALTNAYASLHTADPGGTGTNELTSTNSPAYARIAVAATTGWAAPVSSEGGQMTMNVANITFPNPTVTNKTLTAASQAGTVATFTSTSHGYANGDRVTIAGVTPSEYNGLWTVQNALTNTFDADLTPTSGLGAGSAFGTATKNWLVFFYGGLFDALTTGNFLYKWLIAADGVQVLAGSSPYFIPASALQVIQGSDAA